jgi:hypothetical protein
VNTLVLAFILSVCGALQIRAEACSWRPALQSTPRYSGVAPTATQYTVYRPTDTARVVQDVLSTTSNGSFLSRSLRVITVDGREKNFEMLTGQDGLTFGIIDIATTPSVSAWLQTIYNDNPKRFTDAFAEHTSQVLNQEWLERNNAAGVAVPALRNDNGLVKIEWLRLGLGRLLCDPSARAAQLKFYVEKKIASDKKLFDSLHFRSEFSFAAIVGMSNSGGVAMASTLMRRALFDVKDMSVSEKELQATKLALLAYVSGDPHKHEDDAASVRSILYDGAAISCSPLGHRAKRVCMIAKYFPPLRPAAFSTLGSFQTEYLPAHQ